MGGLSKYARCNIVVIKVFTQMMQEIIGMSPINPDQIYQMIMRTKTFKEKLTDSETTTIPTLMTEGFSKLDICLIYKIAKFFNFIPPPTRQWGATPLSNETEIGDDIERIINGTNRMIHRTDCEMSVEEMSAFFTEFIAVGERIDIYLSKSDNTFKDSISWYKTCPIDDEIEEKAEILQGIESVKADQVQNNDHPDNEHQSNQDRDDEKRTKESGNEKSPHQIQEEEPSTADLDGNQDKSDNKDPDRDEEKRTKQIGDNKPAHKIHEEENSNDLDENKDESGIIDQSNPDRDKEKRTKEIDDKKHQHQIQEEEHLTADQVQNNDHPDNEHQSNQDRDDEKRTKESGNEKSPHQIQEEEHSTADLDGNQDKSDNKDPDRDEEKRTKQIGDNKPAHKIHEEENSNDLDENKDEFGIIDQSSTDRDKEKRTKEIDDKKHQHQIQEEEHLTADLDGDKDKSDYKDQSNPDRDDENRTKEIGDNKHQHQSNVGESSSEPNVKRDQSNTKDQSNPDRDEEKRTKESGDNKHQHQIHEGKNSTDMVQAQSPKTTHSEKVDEKNKDILKEKQTKEIKDEDSKNRTKIPGITRKAEEQILKEQLPINKEIKIPLNDLRDEQSKLIELLQNLRLENFFPDKINLMDVMIVKNPKNTVTYTDIPWVVFNSLLKGNFNSRDKMLHELLEKEAKPTPTLSGKKKLDVMFESLRHEQNISMSLNPMDLLLILFYCSSPTLKHILAQRLFMCKLAIPICFTSLSLDKVLFSTTMLQSIIIDLPTEKEQSQSSDITNCPCHFVGFMRLGKISLSKSKLINEVFTDQYHNTFFNKDCPLGTSTRTISDGTIEGAWFLPSEHSDFTNDIVMFMNLRGDGLTHINQVEIISNVSTVVVVMIDIILLNEDTARNVLLNLYKSVKGVVIALDAISVDLKQLQVICEEYASRIGSFIEQTEFCILSSKGKETSFAVIKKYIRGYVKTLVADIKPSTLSIRLKEKGYSNCEVDNKYKELKEKAVSVLSYIPTKPSNFKDKIVPLQGETWRILTKCCKALNKSSQYTSLHEADKIKQQMQTTRLKEKDICTKLGPFVQAFIGIICEYLDRDFNLMLVIWWLKVLLDDRSGRFLPRYLAKYQQDWEALRSVKNKQQLDKLEEKILQLNKSEYNLAEASFGLEHLVREIGQIYETMIECKMKTLSNMSITAVKLATFGAKILLNGHPFEIMDGDAANIPLIWVKAVMTELKNMIGDKKLMALSIVGVQSSGKSTLLNTMFGFQIAVSAGRCTRGVYMQLVKVEKCSFPVDFIVVFDTEGLRAPELACQKYNHDNELATFAIGLGDITIVNIKGENTSEVKDVLQIAVHAFLRLKLANSRLNLKQSCIFIHQNVPASDASNKIMPGRQKFLEMLDEMTKEAADQENIADIHSFSQVIDFDCNKDVWYLSDVWNGDLPMAPLNPGYCRRVDKVRNKILYNLASVRETYFTITETIVRIDDLWKGILKDDFIFGFRNSLELKAYNNIERKYQELSWKLEKCVSEFVLSKAKAEMYQCSNEEDFTNCVPRILKLCSQQVCMQVVTLNNELGIFVDKDPLKDIMVQWKINKQNRLKMLSEDLIDRSKATIKKTKEEIRIKKLRMEVQKSHEMEINQRAQKLATDMRGAKPTGDVLIEKFDSMWKTWIESFNAETPEDCVSIKDEIESHFWEKFSSDAAFLECQAYDPDSNTNLFTEEYESIKGDILPLIETEYDTKLCCNIVQMSHAESKNLKELHQLENSIDISQIADIHINITRPFWAIWMRKPDLRICKQDTIASINKLFKAIDMYLGDIEKTVKFKVEYAEHILSMIKNHIESPKKLSFALTTDYVLMINTHIIKYAISWFTKLNVNYRKKQRSQSDEKSALCNKSTPRNDVTRTYGSMERNKQMAKLEGSINTSDILTNHISVIKSYHKEKWKSYKKLRNDAVEVTNTILKKIDTRLDEFNSQDERFDISFATEILMLISKDIEIHNKHMENGYTFNLLPPYRAMIVSHVQPFITNFFVSMNDKYNRKHSPKSQMEEYKGTVWTLFKSVFESKTENVIAATFFMKAISKAVTEYTDDLLPILVQEHIITSFGHQKYALMKTILLDLAEKENFNLLFQFILDPSEYTRNWLNAYINREMFDRGPDNFNTYARLAQCQIKKMLQQVYRCISEASCMCLSSDMKDISSWLQSFIKLSRKLNALPFPDESFVHVQNRKVEDLDNYKEIIFNDFNEMEHDIFKPYGKTDHNTVIWKKNPISEIMEKLWGCTAKCMFCAEPCRHTGINHTEEEIPHQCIQHRPQGISGFHWESSKHLVTEFCNFWVQTDQTYKWGKEENKEIRHYKEYKTHFPKWDIVPSSEKSKYWMWVMHKYQNELTEKYKVEKPKFQDTWKIVTKEEAIESLSFV